MTKFKIVALFVFYYATATTLWSQIFNQGEEWKSFTSVGQIRDIAIKDGVVWSGSNGGVLKFDQDQQTFTKFTNTEGLSSNDVVAVEVDQRGGVWFALFDGVLNRYDPQNNSWEVVEDYKNQVIADMVSFGDSLYVALDVGVSLYLINKREVKETYKNLGLSSGAQLEKVTAHSIFISGNEIWVATDRGIAQSDLTLPNLQAPASWTTYTRADGLPSNNVKNIVLVDGIPYAATNFGIARLVNDRWESVNTGLPDLNVKAIDGLSGNNFLSQTSVLALLSSGVYFLDSSDRWQRLGPFLNDVTALKSDESGQIWIGRQDIGIARFDFNSNTWQVFETNSPASNNFAALTLDNKGRLWCASRVRGIHMFDGQTWVNFSTKDGLAKNDHRTILLDNQGRIWAGSWGGGITIIEETADGQFTFTRIDTTGGILAGSDTPAFVVVPAMKMDLQGNIWVLNFLANNTRALAVHTTDDRWVHFSSSEGLGTTLVNAIEIDQFGRVWIGTETNGIRVLDYNDTIFDKSDDDFTQGLTVADGLFDNKIKALAEDKDGVMWIGTEEGLNFWIRGQVGVKFGLINDFVNTIGVDARNNKWFGTVAGVSVLNSDGVTWTHFTTSNSPLVSNDVLSFAFNTKTGEVWIGTSNGLSRLRTPFTEPQENLSLLTGFPNPFIIDGFDRFFTITNLTENTSVVIYDSAGRIVRRFDASEIPGAQVFWDGKDEKGNFVSSGIYVYLAFSENGLSAAGKVAVIRK